jgi:SAM-dependent methyltransferase
VKPSLVNQLLCPVTRSPLTLRDEVVDDHGVREGVLATEGTGRRYPIVNYVPRFVDSESYAHTFGKEWNIFSRLQLDSANGTTISRTRFKALTGFEPEDLRGKRVLEAGCGPGRFVELLAAAGADVVGVDLSAAVEPCHANVGHYPNVNVVQSDLTRLPFRPGSFDFIYSFGVLMCTPDTRASFRSLVPYVRPGGQLCIWVYGYRGPRWIPRPYQVYGQVAKRLSTDRLLRALDVYTGVALPLGRLPVVGGFFRLAMPVSDLTQKREGEDGYDNGRAFSDDLVKEWARLNAFDAFTPEYCRQHDFDEVCSWFEQAGLDEIRRRPTRVAVLGRRP